MIAEGREDVDVLDEETRDSGKAWDAEECAVAGIPAVVGGQNVATSPLPDFSRQPSLCNIAASCGALEDELLGPSRFPSVLQVVHNDDEEEEEEEEEEDNEEEDEAEDKAAGVAACRRRSISGGRKHRFANAPRCLARTARISSTRRARARRRDALQACCTRTAADQRRCRFNASRSAPPPICVSRRRIPITTTLTPLGAGACRRGWSSKTTWG